MIDDTAFCKKGESAVSYSMEQDLQEFARTYDRYADAIFRHCLFRVGDRDRAKELTQDTFMKTWEYIASGKDILNMKAFLYKVASNLVKNEFARRHVSVSLDALQEAYGFDIEDQRESPEHIVHVSEASLLFKHLGALPEQSRTVLIYRFVDGLPVKEIASLLGENQNTISVRINRALAQLKKRFEGNG